MKANSMKTIGKRLTFLILIMCVAVSISAQSYQLSGCVQDENNQPDRKSTRLNSSHRLESRMPSSA